MLVFSCTRQTSQLDLLDMQSWRRLSWNQGSRTTEPRQNPRGYKSASGAIWAPGNQVDRGILIEISRAGMDRGSITVTQTSSLI